MTRIPSRGWATYEAALKAAGERRPSFPGDSGQVLAELGLVTDAGELTPLGLDYFQLRFVRNDAQAAREVLRSCVRDYPPAMAVCQMLEGVAAANRAAAETVLRSVGLVDGLTERSLASLLMLMASVGLIEYSSRSGEIRVLEHVSRQEVAPASVFVAPTTPFSNKIWLRRILAECHGHIHWLDKHFLPVAFEAIWEAADGAVIDRVRILSLELEGNSGTRARRQFRDLHAELSGRGVDLEWRFVDSGLIRDTHDRWIIGSDSARNVPDVGTIYSGKYSELNRSDQADSLNTIFDRYWLDGREAFA